MSSEATQYILGLAATLPVVISDTEAVYVHGLDIIAQQQSGRQNYIHDDLGSSRHWNNDHRCGCGRRIVILEHPRKEDGL